MADDLFGKVSRKLRPHVRDRVPHVESDLVIWVQRDDDLRRAMGVLDAKGELEYSASTPDRLEFGDGQSFRLAQRALRRKGIGFSTTGPMAAHQTAPDKTAAAVLRHRGQMGSI